MASPTPSAGAAGTPVPLRTLTAWALLALAALSVFFGFLAWIFPPSRTDFFGRFDAESFTGIAVLVAPLLAVLLVTKIAPVLPQAKLVSLAALGIYGAAAILGALAFLITFASRFDGLEGGIYAFGGVIQQFGDILITLVRLALLVLAMLWTYQIFNGLGGRLPRLNVATD